MEHNDLMKIIGKPVLATWREGTIAYFLSTNLKDSPGRIVLTMYQSEYLRSSWFYVTEKPVKEIFTRMVNVARDSGYDQLREEFSWEIIPHPSEEAENKFYNIIDKSDLHKQFHKLNRRLYTDRFKSFLSENRLEITTEPLRVVVTI